MKNLVSFGMLSILTGVFVGAGCADNNANTGEAADTDSSDADTDTDTGADADTDTDTDTDTDADTDSDSDPSPLLSATFRGKRRIVWASVRAAM